MGRIIELKKLFESDVELKEVGKEEAIRMVKSGKLVILASDGMAEVMFHGKSLGTDAVEDHEPLFIDHIRVDSFDDWKKFGVKYKQPVIYFTNELYKMPLEGKPLTGEVLEFSDFGIMKVKGKDEEDYYAGVSKYAGNLKVGDKVKFLVIPPYEMSKRSKLKGTIGDVEKIK